VRPQKPERGKPSEQQRTGNISTALKRVEKAGKKRYLVDKKLEMGGASKIITPEN